MQHKISKEGVVETFDNISSQIQELANRQLEHIPVGFGSIIGVISGSEQSKGLGAARLPKGIVAPRVYLQKNRVTDRRTYRSWFMICIIRIFYCLFLGMYLVVNYRSSQSVGTSNLNHSKAKHHQWHYLSL